MTTSYIYFLDRLPSFFLVCRYKTLSENSDTSIRTQGVQTQNYQGLNISITVSSSSYTYTYYYYYYSIGTTAHCGLWSVEQHPSIFSHLPPTLSIFSLPALEELFLLPLSVFSWVFPFFSSLPVLE